MILTPIPDDLLPTALDTVLARLPPGTMVHAAFRRIAATRALVPLGVDTAEHRAQAVALARAVGMGVVDEEPAAAWSWDGRAVRTRTEAYVLVHEVAHWLLCPPERRGLLDFGLGAGPESSRIAEADAQIAVDKATQIVEEALASLLGILWEVELGQPAICAFLEQNWLEGWDCPACAENFAANLAELHRRGLVDGEGRPVGPEDCAGVRPHRQTWPIAIRSTTQGQNDGAAAMAEPRRRMTEAPDAPAEMSQTLAADIDESLADIEAGRVVGSDVVLEMLRRRGCLPPDAGEAGKAAASR